MWSLGDFVLQCWEEILYCRCDGDRDGCSISDKTKSRTAKLRQVSHRAKALLANESANEWTPIFGLLLFPSLSFLGSFFPSGLLLKKILQHDVASYSFQSMLPLKFQGTWIVPSNNPFLGKQTSKKNSTRILIFRMSSWSCFEYLCQSTQRRISFNTFFLQGIRTFWSSIWSSTVEVPFICTDLCRFSWVLSQACSGEGKTHTSIAFVLRYFYAGTRNGRKWWLARQQAGLGNIFRPWKGHMSAPIGAATVPFTAPNPKPCHIFRSTMHSTLAQCPKFLNQSSESRNHEQISIVGIYIHFLQK